MVDKQIYERNITTNRYKIEESSKMSIDIAIEKMPTAYYLNKNDKMSIPLSHINTADLDRGNKIINMGAHLEEYGNVLPVLIMMCEEDCERRITHETIHIILYQIEGEETTDLFDVIDTNQEITGCGYKKLDMKAWVDKYNYSTKTYDGLVKYLYEQIEEHDKELWMQRLDYQYGRES